MILATRLFWKIESDTPKLDDDDARAGGEVQHEQKWIDAVLI